MAGRGNTIPKDPATRRRRNPEVRTTVVQDNRVRGPGLPAGVVKGAWHPRTVAWWATWRRSAQAQTFLPTDWDFLLDTALVHHHFSGGRLELASELRLRGARLGGTPLDRLSLRYDIERPEKAVRVKAPVVADAEVTDLASRRARLSGE